VVVPLTLLNMTSICEPLSDAEQLANAIAQGDLTSLPKAIEGNLTIKGVTKPVTLQVTNFLAMPHPMMKKPALGANAFTTIKRTEFNAGKFAPYVGDEVRIDIAIEAVAP